MAKVVISIAKNNQAEKLSFCLFINLLNIPLMNTKWIYLNVISTVNKIKLSKVFQNNLLT
jgi:hypothetical protein